MKLTIGPTRQLRLATLVTLASAIVDGVLAQPPAPTDAVQLGDPEYLSDIRFPLTATQCEPVLIYYNVPSITSGAILFFFTPDEKLLLRLDIPTGVGYVEWICDIPAGYSFTVEEYYSRYYVVQQGSSSSCLGNLTTTYKYASYSTTNFRSYTEHLPDTTSPSVHSASTVFYPFGSFSTVTANPDLALASKTTTPSLSGSLAATPSVTTSSVRAAAHPTATTSAPSHKLKTSAIAGGVIGGFVVTLLVFLVMFVFLRRRRSIQPQENTIGIDPFIEVAEVEGDSASVTNMSSPRKFSHPASPVVPLPVKKRPVLDDLEAHPVSNPPRVPGPASSGSSSATVIPQIATGTSPAIPEDPSPTAQIDEPRNAPSNFAAALDVVSRMRPNASQREVLVASLNTPIGMTINSLPVMPQSQPEIAPVHESQNDSEDMTVALNSVSRLNPGERRALLSMLNNLITPPSPSLSETREHSVVASSAPPPYGG